MYIFYSTPNSIPELLSSFFFRSICSKIFPPIKMIAINFSTYRTNMRHVNENSAYRVGLWLWYSNRNRTYREWKKKTTMQFLSFVKFDLELDADYFVRMVHLSTVLNSLKFEQWYNFFFWIKCKEENHHFIRLLFH